jgi:class 3 adenylate cyclase
LAFFGDFTDTNHAADAVSAALEMQEKVPKLKEHLGFDLVIRIGIHTGYVTVGNIGSDQHLDYTVIGKNVNLAQRLESTCDPGKILISDSTYQMIKDKVEIADSREVSLKGFARPIKVCSILKLKG